MSFFGQNIRFLRNKAQLSQTNFAELFKLKRAAVGAYEEGRAEPRVEVFVDIAQHFGVAVEDLICKNLQETWYNSDCYGICGDALPYVKAHEIPQFIVATKSNTIYNCSNKIKIPGLTNSKFMIAFEYEGNILITRELYENLEALTVAKSKILLLLESGLAPMQSTSENCYIKKYEILYIIKSFDSQDFTELMLAEISKKIEKIIKN